MTQQTMGFLKTRMITTIKETETGTGAKNVKKEDRNKKKNDDKAKNDNKNDNKNENKKNNNCKNCNDKGG